MTKIFKSKVDTALVIFLCALLGPVIILMIVIQSWSGLSILVATTGFILHLFTSTYYQIEADQLRIKSGFIYNKIIPISTIKCIVKSKNILSSPALSFDRIEIRYGKGDYVLISPKERATFIADLQKINPQISISV